MSQRISSIILPWPGGRWRAELSLDGYLVEKSFHDTYEQAVAWCESAKAKLAREVRA